MWSDHCHESFMENYAFTNHTMAVMLGCESEVQEWGPPLGQPVEQMFDCAGGLGCAQLSLPCSFFSVLNSGQSIIRINSYIRLTKLAYCASILSKLCTAMRLEYDRKQLIGAVC